MFLCPDKCRFLRHQRGLYCGVARSTNFHDSCASALLSLGKRSLNRPYPRVGLVAVILRLRLSVLQVGTGLVNSE